MPKKNIKELMELAMEIGGEEAQLVVKALQKKKEATDEELEEMTEIRVNTIRKVLYSLHEMGLADFKRVRDKESGWYYYYWHLETKRLPELIKARKLKELERLKRERDSTPQVYFWCGKEGHPTMTLDEAFEYEFRCPLCGDIMMQYDNTEKIRELDEMIERLEVELGIRKVVGGGNNGKKSRRRKEQARPVRSSLGAAGA
ncbi:MAG: transcription factor [Thermococci archaeon]|nr:transcription factor [Thermococci archaeon]